MLILFVMPLICWGGGRTFFLNSEFDFFFDDLHLQIIASISPKTYAENSSVQWAIFIFTSGTAGPKNRQCVTGALVNMFFIPKLNTSYTCSEYKCTFKV